MQIQILDKKPRHVAGTSKNNGRPFSFFVVEAALLRQDGAASLAYPVELNFDAEGDCPTPGSYQVDAESLIYASRNRRLSVAVRPEHFVSSKPAQRAA